MSSVTQNTVFNLSSSSGGTVTFYSDAAGTIPITQVTIAGAASSAAFYYRDTKSGASTVTAAISSGDALGCRRHGNGQSGGGLPGELSGPASMTAGTVSGAFTLTSRDSASNAAGVTQNTVFNLSSNSTGTVTFYSDAAGAVSITQVTIASGASSAVFYYRDTKSGAPAVTAAVASGNALGSAQRHGNGQSGDRQPARHINVRV